MKILKSKKVSKKRKLVAKAEKSTRMLLIKNTGYRSVSLSDNNNLGEFPLSSMSTIEVTVKIGDRLFAKTTNSEGESSLSILEIN